TSVYNGSNSTFSWNTTTATSGSVTLTATATDGNGATGSATRTVTVANTSTPPSGGGSASVTLTKPGDKVWTGNRIQLGASAAGVARRHLHQPHGGRHGDGHGDVRPLGNGRQWRGHPRAVARRDGASLADDERHDGQRESRHHEGRQRQPHPRREGDGRCRQD